MSAFYQSLKYHPGVPLLFILCTAGFIVGLESSVLRGIMGACAMFIVFGIPVCYTAWTDRKQYEVDL